MEIRIEQKVLAAMFWNGETLMGGCKFDWAENMMVCQILGNGCLIDFSFPCFNDGNDLSAAISKVKMRLRKEYKNISFIKPVKN